MDRKEIVKEFIVESLLFGESDALNDDTSFFETGLIDSTGIIEVINFLEKKFNISIKDEELIPDNLGNINNIDRFLNLKLQNN